MTTHKLERHQNDIPYTMQSRDVVQKITNPNALAIWTFLMSLPDDWKVSETHLRKHFDIGRTTYLKAMKCLRELNLYKIQRFVDENNRFTGSCFHVYGIPYIRENVYTEKRTYITENNIPTENDINTENNTLVGKPDHSQDRESIVQYLNLKTGCRFKPNSKNAKKHIDARLSDGHTVEDCMAVIDSKVTEWTGSKFQTFLRPETLFAGKFDSYLASAHIQQPQDAIDILLNGETDEQARSNANSRPSFIADRGELGTAIQCQTGGYATETPTVGEGTDPFGF